VGDVLPVQIYYINPEIKTSLSPKNRTSVRDLVKQIQGIHRLR
jgi:hypothetical protein